MSRRKPNAAPVTLFPFLAVLMCTMGALIVLLVLVSAQVRDDAVARAREERDRQAEPAIVPPEVEAPLLPLVTEPDPVIAEAKPEELAPLPPVPDLASLRQTLADLNSKQKSLQKVLADRDTRLVMLNREADSARRETTLAVAQREQLEAQLRQAVLARRAAVKELDELDTERQRLLASILDSKKLIEQRQRELNADNEFVIVPFDGQSGTSRRPIIIECTDKSIRFVSEEIELTPKQLLGFTPENNPLLAGASEIVRFWATHNSVQDDPKSEPVPYVLLVVRPSGTVGFYLARRFLAELGADYGYELVEEDFNFAAPPGDPRAKELALAAIAEMLAAGRSRSQPSTFSESLASGGTSPGGGTDPGGNGRNENGPSVTGNRGTFSGMTNSGRDIRSFDSRILRHGAGPASRGFFNSSDFQRHQDGQAGTGLTAGGSAFGPGNGVPFRSGNGGSAGSDSARTGSSPGQTGSVARGTTKGNSLGPGGTGASDLPVGLRSTPQLGALGSSSGRAEPPKPFDFSTGQNPLVAPPATSRGSAGTGENPELDGGLGSAESVARNMKPQRNGDPVPAGPTNPARSDSTKVDATGRPAGLASSQRSPSGSAAQRAGSRDSRPTGSGASASESPGAAAAGLPQATLTMSTSPQSSARRQSPRNVRRQWGIRNPSGTIALEKPIVIYASREKVVIDGKYKITRTVDRAPAQIVDWTILAIDRVATEWGVPPRRFYWVPAVTLVIEPGGDLLRGPLEDKLRRSGVSVESRFSAGSVFDAQPGGNP